ncbi:MAG TPA: RNA polymerase sigma factor [Solirubrobacteraceae bacterium]|jgi:RNA polymerase sigma factor (sigma-70 family)|nr:RNA polymerase sigma factor [Solirubrobacteraceae bacterium]
MEVSALKHSGLSGLRGPLPLLRLQSDERLVALARRGHHSAFETLVGRYQARLLAFCRHMLGSREDAEDVLQEVFAASFNAMLADEREINVRPWLYRIARNRCLNHLRRQTAIGQDSMDVHLADHGVSTGERAQARENLRELLTDVQQLPETQRTALLLREIDALSYEQIADAMETTVPSVKSLLVRARVGLAEMAESRRLTCADVRQELGEVAEGLARTSPPVRRHLKACDRCREFRSQLQQNNRALAALFPVGPLILLKKLAITKLSFGGAHVGAGAGASATAAAGATAGASTGGIITAGAGAIAAKAVAGFAAAALVTAGAVEVSGNNHRHHALAHHAVAAAPIALHHAAAAAPVAPVLVRTSAQPISAPIVHRRLLRHRLTRRRSAPKTTTDTTTTTITATIAPTTTAGAQTTTTAPATPPPAPTVQVQTDTTVLPSTPPPTTPPTTTPVTTTPVTTTPPTTTTTPPTTTTTPPTSTTPTTTVPTPPVSPPVQPAP